MNLAVSSLVIFLLVSPAILARRSYYTRDLSRNYIQHNTIQEIFSSVFLSFILHSIWVPVTNLVGRSINYEIVIKLLFSPDKITDYSKITENVGFIALYFATLTAVSCGTGYFLRWWFRSKKWDRKIQILQYDNNWAYLFKGEVVDQAKYKEAFNEGQEIKFEDIGVRFVDVMVKSEDRVIYQGVLVDFHLNDNNSLGYIVLSRPINKVIQVKDKDSGFITELPPIEIDSHYFVIPNEDILNINIRYGKKRVSQVQEDASISTPVQTEVQQGIEKSRINQQEKKSQGKRSGRKRNYKKNSNSKKKGRNRSGKR